MPVHTDADHAAIAKATLEQFIRPGYAHFTESTEALSQSVSALCAKPAALKDTQKAFAATVEAWNIADRPPGAPHRCKASSAALCSLLPSPRDAAEASRGEPELVRRRKAQRRSGTYSAALFSLFGWRRYPFRGAA